MVVSRMERNLCGRRPDGLVSFCRSVIPAGSLQKNAQIHTGCPALFSRYHGLTNGFDAFHASCLVRFTALDTVADIQAVLL
jgi:hypothetical protein